MREIKDIPVNKCVVPETRITAVYDEELEKLLRSSLAATGQIVPIVTIEHDGVYYVSDGKHRLEEAKLRGDETIRAVVEQGSPVDALLMNLITNRTRGKVKASDMVEVIKALWVEHGLDSDQIKERTGFSRDYIERLMKVSEASAEVLDALDRELIGVGVAFEISRLPSELQQSQLVNHVQTYRSTTKEIKQLVDNVLREMENMQGAPQPQHPQIEPPAPRCDYCKEEHDPRDLAMKVVCPGCNAAAWTAAADRRQAAMTKEEVTE